MLTKSKLWADVRACLVLAFPLAGAQLAQTVTGFVDTVMMGWLGSEVIAAGGLGAVAFTSLLTLASAIVSAVSPLAAEAYGAGDSRKAGRVGRQGLWLALLLSLPLTALVLLGDQWLPWLGQQPQTIALTTPYLHAIAWGYLPGVAFAALRSFVAALSRPGAIITIVGLGTVINIVGNYSLMFGKFGLPQLGLAGIGLASALSFWSMLLLLIGYILSQPSLRSTGVLQHLRHCDSKMLRELVRVGLPIGGLVGVEVGLFTVSTFLVGQFGTVPLAAHQIALQSAAITFNVPLGVAFATTVLVGQRLGQADLRGARRAGLIGICIGGSFMVAMGLLFWLAPATVVGLYLDVNDPANAAVINLAKSLLGIAALFQLVDGIQVVAAGALRGLQDTRVPLLIGIAAYWCIGLTIGWFLSMKAGLGAIGLWWGWAIGLTVAAIVLTWRFTRLTTHLIHQRPVAQPVS
jgi:MATE family multidrug resistance protein